MAHEKNADRTQFHDRIQAQPHQLLMPFFAQTQFWLLKTIPPPGRAAVPIRLSNCYGFKSPLPVYHPVNPINPVKKIFAAFAFVARPPPDAIGRFNPNVLECQSGVGPCC